MSNRAFEAAPPERAGFDPARLADTLSFAAQRQLFHDNAARIYRIPATADDPA